MTKIILFALLILSLLALLSFSPVSIPMMGMSEMHAQLDHHASQNSSVMPCCEMIGNSCTSFVCYLTEYISSSFVRETTRFATINVETQPFYLEILFPPPKA